MNTHSYNFKLINPKQQTGFHFQIKKEVFT